MPLILACTLGAIVILAALWSCRTPAPQAPQIDLMQLAALIAAQLPPLPVPAAPPASGNRDARGRFKKKAAA